MDDARGTGSCFSLGSAVLGEIFLTAVDSFVSFGGEDCDEGGEIGEIPWYWDWSMRFGEQVCFRLLDG